MEKNEHKEIERLQRDLHLVGRINVMGEFASSLAHELNQPLTAIVHDIDTALMVSKENNNVSLELKEVLLDIQRHVLRAGDIIRGLRDIIRKEPKNLAHFELNELLSQTIALIRPEAQDYKIEIQCIHNNELIVFANRTHLAQIILNLVRNSIEALQSNSEIKKIILIKTYELNSHIKISIKDNGPGFVDGCVPFTKFQTTKLNGIGLGLSICESLIKINHGKIDHYPVTPHGACFVITLPKEKI